MLNLNLKDLEKTDMWEKAGFELPKYDIGKTNKNTQENPKWLHFGGGNIFRGFIASLQQELLNSNKADTGIIAVESFDTEIIDKIYKPYNNLSALVIMNPTGKFDKKIIGSISESLAGDPLNKDDWKRLQTIITKPSLQMVSFTITEKGYNLTALSGDYLPQVKLDMESGPQMPKNIIAIITSLAYCRFLAGELPIAYVSMDNCAHNGEKLENTVKIIAQTWADKGFVDMKFVLYLNDPNKVTFPWSMIDKITPRPSEKVRDYLNDIGFVNTEIICTSKNTYIAPFVNTEVSQYLVIEDNFPNGRLSLEQAGVIFTDRETVENVERMKVTTCLNPLHTSLAIYGCLLGYNTIAEEMKDAQLKLLVEKVGYVEGMPVVVDPGIIAPKEFIKDVIENRFSNPYIPDTPQRIATDTSQKMAIRFGETIKSYCARPELDVKSLKYIPLVIAGWFRYLLALNDNGEKMELSFDPMMDQLKQIIAGIELGKPEQADGKLRTALSSKELFGVDLYEIGLGEKIEGYFKELISGKHMVRKTLIKYLS